MTPIGEVLKRYESELRQIEKDRGQSYGELRRQVGHVVDVMATCVDVADATYPTTFRGRDILPMEGRSLLPPIDGKPTPPRTLVFEHERNAALLEGDWKLVGQRVITRRGLAPQAQWQLYNVMADPCEQSDRAGEEPERVARMLKVLEREAGRTLVLPAP